jgi:molybdopterin-guanine dinucleotide biosynthesis protein A
MPASSEITGDPAIAATRITGLVLAGGLARRMGGQDKGFVELAGQPMVVHVLSRLAPQVGPILISANRNPERYAEFGRPVLGDDVAGFLGPLAGVLTGLRACTTEFLLTAPCDAPLLPPDLALRLGSALIEQCADVAVADDGDRLQTVFMLVRREVLPSLEAFLAGGQRKIDAWFTGLRLARADFSDCAPSFANVNDPAERDALENALREERRAGSS